MTITDRWARDLLRVPPDNRWVRVFRPRVMTGRTQRRTKNASTHIDRSDLFCLVDFFSIVFRERKNVGKFNINSLYVCINVYTTYTECRRATLTGTISKTDRDRYTCCIKVNT